MTDGMGAAGDAVRYSMHINLGLLQRNIDQSVSKDVEGEGLTGVAYNKKGKTNQNRKGTKQKGKETNQKGKEMHLHVPGLVKREPVLTRESSRTDGSGTLITLPSADEDRKEGMETGGGDGDGGDEEEEEGGEGKLISLAGLTLAILPHKEFPNLSAGKRETVKMIREAGEAIRRSRLQLKKQAAAAKTLKASPRQDSLNRDEFVFTRVQGTMHLTLLNRMDRLHRTRKANEESEAKASLVARVRRERVTRRGKIEAFQNHLKERVHVWKCQEEGRLEHQREALDRERQAESLQRCQHRELQHTSAKKQQEDRQLSNHFRQNSALIGNTLRSEDRKVSLSHSSAAVRDKVRQAKQEELEQQEEARKYLEHRRNRLCEQGKQGRHDVDARMLEVR